MIIRSMPQKQIGVIGVLVAAMVGMALAIRVEHTAAADTMVVPNVHELSAVAAGVQVRAAGSIARTTATPGSNAYGAQQTPRADAVVPVRSVVTLYPRTELVPVAMRALAGARFSHLTAAAGVGCVPFSPATRQCRPEIPAAIRHAQTPRSPQDPFPI